MGGWEPVRYARYRANATRSCVSLPASEPLRGDLPSLREEGRVRVGEYRHPPTHLLTNPCLFRAEALSRPHQPLAEGAHFQDEGSDEKKLTGNQFRCSTVSPKIIMVGSNDDSPRKCRALDLTIGPRVQANPLPLLWFGALSFHNPTKLVLE